MSWRSETAIGHSGHLRVFQRMVFVDDQTYRLHFSCQTTAANAVLVDVFNNRRAFLTLKKFLLLIDCHCGTSDNPMSRTQRKDEIEKNAQIFLAQKINMSLDRQLVMHINPQCANNFLFLVSNLHTMRLNR